MLPVELCIGFSAELNFLKKNLAYDKCIIVIFIVLTN